MRVDKAFDTLRTFLLCRVSKLGVTRSYFRHIHNEYPDLHVPERPEVRWEQYFKNGEEPEDPPIPCGGRYRWRQRFGKVAYKAWWNVYWSESQALKEKDPGRDAIWRVSNAIWWEWNEGSAPFYWRWPREYQETIRDGLEIWFAGEKPAWKQPQRVEKDKATRQKVIAKISTIRKRKYIMAG